MSTTFQANVESSKLETRSKIAADSVATAAETVTIGEMYPTDTILKFGLPLGRIGGAKLRVSFLFLVVAAALAWRTDNVYVSLTVTGILLVSVLLHEVAHLVVTRSTAGDLDELHLWPLGGLSEPFGRGFWRDHLQTMLAGPFVNLVIAASCLLKLAPADLSVLLNPAAAFDSHTLTWNNVCQIVFGVNVLLVAVNLIPITPFDTGVLVRTYMTTRFSEVETRDIMVRLGLVTGTLGLITGFVIDMNSVTAVSAFILVFHFHEILKWRDPPSSGDFFQYDFEESLSEWDQPDTDDLFPDCGDETQTHEEILERWRHQREEERIELERQERQREDRQVDEILQKLHVHGRESLNANEIHLLNRVSDRYRNRDQQHHQDAQ